MAQANAFQLTKIVNEITLTETDGAVILPEGIEGMSIKIKNNSTADVRVFPTSLGVINDLGADGFYILPFDNSEVFNCFKANNWYSQSSGIYFVEKQVLSAEILTLQSSPFEFIAAPGTGNMIQIVGHPTVEIVFNTTVYATSLDVFLIMTGVSKKLYDQISILGATTDDIRTMDHISAASSNQILKNTSIILSSTSDPTAGDSTGIVRAFYRIIYN